MSGPTANDYDFTKDDKAVEEKWREFFEKNFVNLLLNQLVYFFYS